jgi:Lrp/AsnC family transcriptional regulator for asnA, asnC and gidA
MVQYVAKTGGGQTVTYRLDAVDRQIISLLQQDGRTSNVEVARQVGVSEATVRKRLDRLLEEGVMRITAVPNAAKVGFPTVTFVALDVDLAYLDRIADRLGRLPEVRAIYYTTGENDLVVEAWFDSSEQLLHFLTQQIAAIPGIKRAATSHVLRTLKDSSTWVLPSQSPPSILVVDDDADFVEVMRLALTKEGYDVNVARTGQEALAAMRVAVPDLVIMDIMMNGVLDGLRTAKEMRADSDLRDVPLLMISSIGQSGFAGLLPKEEELPADNFLVKPLDIPVLLTETERLVNTR